MAEQIEVYEDRAGEWRWRHRSGSNIIADSGEGYSDRGGALKAAQRQANDRVPIVLADSTLKETADDGG